MNFIPPADSLLQTQFPEISKLEIVGDGGFKIVYRAEINGRAEAFKLIQLPAAANQSDTEELARKEAVGRIRREIEALAACTRPEIVKLGSLPFTSFTVGTDAYVAYSEEFLEGFNLWNVIRQNGPKPLEKELRTLFYSLLMAISELWSKGYVHRDIKPQNVMSLASNTRPFVLLDLGIAWAVQEPGLTANPNQRVLATYRYIAPEMMTPGFRASLDYRSDLYTTALTVFEYAAQQHPLARSRDDLMQTISRALHQPAAPLKSVRPDLSDELCSLVDQMLKKKPALRPANLSLLLTKLKGSL